MDIVSKWQEGGFLMYAIAAAGLAGAVISAKLGRSGSKQARVMSVALPFFTLAFGTFGTFYGRYVVRQAVRNVDPPLLQTLLHQGYQEANTVLQFAILVTVLQVAGVFVFGKLKLSKSQ